MVNTTKTVTKRNRYILRCFLFCVFQTIFQNSVSYDEHRGGWRTITALQQQQRK